MGFRVWDLGCGVQGLGFRAWGLGFRFQGVGVRFEGLVFRVSAVSPIYALHSSYIALIPPI